MEEWGGTVAWDVSQLKEKLSLLRRSKFERAREKYSESFSYTKQPILLGAIHIHMTSALRGEGVGSKADSTDSTDRLREWDRDKGEGVVIRERPPMYCDRLKDAALLLPRKREAHHSRTLGVALLHISHFVCRRKSETCS